MALEYSYPRCSPPRKDGYLVFEVEPSPDEKLYAISYSLLGGATVGITLKMEIYSAEEPQIESGCTFYYNTRYVDHTLEWLDKTHLYVCFSEAPDASPEIRESRCGMVNISYGQCADR